MKVLTEADYIALANLCQAYSTLVIAQKQMNKTGILYKSKSGYIQQSPLLGIIHTQTTIVNNLLREFGLTPSSRTRVAIVPLPARWTMRRRRERAGASLMGARSGSVALAATRRSPRPR